MSVPHSKRPRLLIIKIRYDFQSFSALFCSLNVKVYILRKARATV